LVGWLILTARLHLVLAVVAVLLVIADPVVRDALAVVAAERVRRTLGIDAAATCAAQAATWKMHGKAGKASQ